MRVIPALDLRAGRAVWARGGHRADYAPADSVLLPEREAGDALALAGAFRERLGCDECYVADLDAITGGRPQHALLESLAAVAGPLLVDGGVADPVAAKAVVAHGAARVVVGLETLPSFAALREIARAIGSARVVFGLDLRGGTPVVRSGARHRATPLELTRAAVAAGVPALLVLDLARVGTGRGADLHLVAEIRRAHPTVELLAGGGVGALRDLERLADAGCDGALVATALHDGGLGKHDLDAVRGRGPGRLGGHPSASR